MRERIELNEEAPPLRAPGRILNELCSHALETQPEECCGLVLGSEREPFQVVYRCRNEMTVRHQSDPIEYPRDGREAFYMSEADVLAASREAEARGQKVTAVYHSHVGAGAYLSDLDQQHADHALFPFPDAAQIVIAVWARHVSKVGIFQRDGHGGTFQGRLLEADPS